MSRLELLLDDMASFVSRGDFEGAAKLGNSGQIPLGLTRSAFSSGALLASRPSCTVRKAEYEGRTVAVKQAKIGTARDLQFFRKEIFLLCQLAHPNITALLAARLLPPDYLMLLELGSRELAAELHEHGWRPGPHEIVLLAEQLASALAHVHSRGILHRDLNPSNILLDESGAAKLTDFSIAELAADLAEEQADRRSLLKGKQPTGGFHKRHLIGTLQYLSPEVLQKRPAGYASDVYAWAVTVNEVATGVFPFSDCTRDNPKAHTVLDFGYGRSELAAAVAAEGLRPTLAEHVPPALQQLIARCWHLDPAQRPTAEELVSQLAIIRSTCSEHAANDALPHSKVAAGAHASSAGSTKDQQQHAAEQAGVSSHGSAVTAELQQAPWHTQLGTSSFTPQVSAGAYATAGRRGGDRMEDTHVVASPLLQSEPTAHLLAAFDGHRGAAAALHCSQHLQPHLLGLWQQHAACEGLLKASFLALDRAFQEQQDCRWNEEVRRKGLSAGLRTWPGCTAIAALLVKHHLWVANAGDCRAVLVRAGQAQQLTRAHTADDTAERERLQRDHPGVLRNLAQGWRVGEVGLQVTRSIGDADLKQNGVTAEAEVAHVELGSGDTCLILGSDGLWDHLSSQAAADLVRDTVKDPFMCARRLVTEALTNGSGDNITAIVAFLQPVSTLELVFGGSRPDA